MKIKNGGRCMFRCCGNRQTSPMLTLSKMVWLGGGALFTLQWKTNLMVSWERNAKIHARQDCTNKVVESELVEFWNEGVVFPSMEAFERRIQITSIYYVFCDRFLRTTIGDAKWKADAEDDTNMFARIGTEANEAFTLVFLQNYYHAWLMENKVIFLTLKWITTQARTSKT